MGYEVVIKYREGKDAKEEQEVKEKTIQVGQLTEEVPIETLAGKVLAQLARRNISVVDIEIYEYAKKKVTYKEDEDGIRIKNKKFRFDDGAAITMQDAPDEQDQLANLLNNPKVLALLQQQNGGQVHPHQILRQQPPPQPQPQNGNLNIQTPRSMTGPLIQPPVRYEVYDPGDKTLLSLAQSKGWVFTVGKRYPIFGEKPGMKVTDGMIYTTTDDKGKQQLVSDKFFVPPQTKLIGEGEFIEDHLGMPVGGGSKEPHLDWGGSIDLDMPQLR